MKNIVTRERRIPVILFLLTFPLLFGASLPWGFFAHKKINQLAVFTLPPELIGPFKKNVEYLTIHSVDPDKRRYAFRQEAVRHYIDLDMYNGKLPPQSWEFALVKYVRLLLLTSADTVLVERKITGDSMQLSAFHDTVFISQDRWKSFIRNRILYNWESLPFRLEGNDVFRDLGMNIEDGQEVWVSEGVSHYGILPWHLQRVYRQLISDFQSADLDKIMNTAADLGHYIGDAHVPLHTSSNYNGQKTGQYGIHAFWESRIPELFADASYDLLTGPAEYINNPDSFFWDIIFTSHSLVDSVLWAEKEASHSFPAHAQYCLEKRGASIVRVPCKAFSKAFSDLMGAMVETRMRDAIFAIGSVWYSAWVDAGRPSLVKRTVEKRDSSSVFPHAIDNSSARPHEGAGY